MGISELLGKTLINIERMPETDKWDGGERIVFHTSSGEQYAMFHSQDCFERVGVEDITGDINDLIGSPITKAEESTSNENPKDGSDESFTWTFYHLATVRGYVTIRWYGESNGYYSERVDFEKV